MGFGIGQSQDSSQHLKSSKTDVVNIDTAESFAGAQSNNGIASFNFAGAKVGDNRSYVSGKGVNTLGATGSGGGGDGGNSGIQVITTDLGAINSAFDFAKSVYGSGQSAVASALNALSEQASDSLSGLSESKGNAPKMDKTILFLGLVGLVVGIYVVSKGD